MLSMSMAPRPQTTPSSKSPENGSRDQPSGFTGTTSVWPMSSRPGAVGSVPSMRASRLARPGCGSARTRSRPGPSNTDVRRSALRASWPDSALPSFTHALRMSPWSSSVTSPAMSSVNSLIGAPCHSAGPERQRATGQSASGRRRAEKGAVLNGSLALRARSGAQRREIRDVPRKGWLTVRDMTPKHVVVDGSNIATEGRNLPSLAQLDEAVRSFLEERPPEDWIVVVDAPSEHRIAPSEKQMYDEALAAGELIPPPAGTIGRGDKFLL